ncbi:MAG: hypothetical protein A2655_00615 [Candidatus Yanofskybacteria bacterium RIFCSPHIGHO2_01_FULL_43_42]|uniref:Uncharacterized protein n=1 Tax=Candidatus Yanofskybacteria bacterium RIFCSPLOWO2_01_FULL_43_22 TaxID=1802695 RepID=A0A1F8GHW2_9BACT|nr:MAG: hypothetical protein A2655_00615 [Candidatus Yanofskybacteria bacterium RIFCSPHIGHO2_01_FULL_43_42]OGN13757.1 MAG: hypothetical protein A3D48_00365 [Candidatus Yanofskybacteria bacterium RIFCSPHIGHO2_02_FULL_43_17]OGN24276.1 MAG: hypothetical protein A3A13_03815 [Candidatus Yanofskybacteria bacterium RIFCSPLOWO2_01_FULL_43_22]
MTEKTAVQQGFFWHVHHTIFLEWCYDYEERAQYIRTNKPQNEQEIRLRLFKPVQGRLPEAVVKARQVYDEARPAFDKAYQAYNEAYQVYGKANQAYIEAYQAYDKALIDNTAKIEALHANECPNCPWNGHTIFPNS